MISRIIFMSVASIALLGISYFTSKMYVLGFQLSAGVSRSAFVVFLLIPLLFIASMILSRSASFPFGSFGYTAVHILSGFGLYLFFGAIILSLVIIACALTNTTIPLFIPWFIVSLSLLLGIIGLIQARSIVVTPYTVILQNAPESWNGKTAVLVTDTHFGLVNSKKFSDKVVTKILSLNPDFVLHAGDFYDGPHIDTLPITESWSRLTSSIPVFYAPGNHEGYGTYAAFMDSARAANITVLEDSKTEYEGVQIAGITYRDGKENTDATKAIEGLALTPSMPSILINHPPTSLPAIYKNGVDLMVSGHTHNGQFWPLNYVTRAVYGIYSYGLNTYVPPLSPEDSSAPTQVLTSRGVGTFGPPFRTFNQSELVLITFKTK